SWPVTGSTGIWPALFRTIGITARPFQASNCGVVLPWPATVTTAHAGKPLKNLRVTAGPLTALGEATITAHGLEGNAIYPVVPALRDALDAGAQATVRLDLKPTNTAEDLLRKLSGAAPPEYAKALHLDRAQLAVLKAFTPKERFRSPDSLVQDVKDLHLPVTALRPIAEAISVVGGIAPDDLAPDLSFKRHPHLFAIGEMVDWDAPTGGFLLQGCFAMGRHAAQAILARG
ncbi:MAG: NAD(P)/FAD-dependent oxidoreductase, partial [Bacteroidetes bacterium]|nr:NAD(P)/FAD-dependent oxidoreductase [Bacteroidota bacterium]